MKVKTLRRHSYDRQGHAPGDVYEIANPKHVQILEAVKKIARVPEKIVPVVVEKEIPVEQKPKQKRKYKRRDMVPEFAYKTKAVSDAETIDNDEI